MPGESPAGPRMEMQGDYLRATPSLVCSQYPAFSEFHKLVADGNVPGQAGKPHAFACVIHAFLFGGHSQKLPCKGSVGAATFATGAAGQTTSCKSFFTG
jgi:hypothetical protein